MSKPLKVEFYKGGKPVKFKMNPKPKNHKRAIKRALAYPITFKKPKKTKKAKKTKIKPVIAWAHLMISEEPRRIVEIFLTKKKPKCPNMGGHNCMVKVQIQPL